MIKLSDYVIKYIEELSIRHIFMLPGGGCMHLVDSLGQSKKIKYVPMLHEQACAIAADAYSQYKEFLGVALVTTGPGATNTLTGIAASWIDSVPVLFIGGQVKTSDMISKKGVRQMGPQEVDMLSMVKPITKYAVTVTDPKTILYHLEMAIATAIRGRPGPVWLEIPLDVQAAMIDENKVKGFKGLKIDPRPSAKEIRKVIKLIKKAKRPVVLLGNGARLNSMHETDYWIHKLQIPVLLTWRAADMMAEDDPLYFGRPGTIGQRASNFIQQNADLVIAIGARLDLLQLGFDGKNFAKGAKKVVVDIDKKELNKFNFSIDVAINARAACFINMLTDNGVKIDIKEWLTYCNKMKQKYSVPDYASLPKTPHLTTYKFIDCLSNVLREDDVLVPASSGSAAEVTMQTIRVKKGLRIINSPGLGSMGFGLPAGIGACLASSKRTIGIIGDGDLQHNIQELATMRRLNLSYKLFILNNKGYASIKQMQDNRFEGRYVACGDDSGVVLPEIQAIAKAYNIPYCVIDDADEKIVSGILSLAGPVICEVIVDPNTQTVPKVSSAMTAEGKMVSRPMEDLYPFLDRKEFKENMISEKEE